MGAELFAGITTTGDAEGHENSTLVVAVTTWLQLEP